MDELLALHKLEAYQKAFDDAGLDDLQELLAVRPSHKRAHSERARRRFYSKLYSVTALYMHMQLSW